MAPKVENTSAKEKGAEKPTAVTAVKVDVPPSALEILHRNIVYIDKYVDTRDRLYLLRAMRYSGFLRNHLVVKDLKQAIETYVLDTGRKQTLLGLVNSADFKRPENNIVVSKEADVDMNEGTGSTSNNQPNNVDSTVPEAPKGIKLPKPNGAAAIELEVYLTVLVISAHVSKKNYSVVGQSSGQLIEYLSNHNRRTLDFFQARVWEYLALAHEKNGTLPSISAAVLAAYRSTCLRHDEFGQAVLINILLRTYISEKDYSAASALLSSVDYPEAASPNQYIRYLLYVGKVAAIQTEYSKALSAFTQAFRKAPASAPHFALLAQKFSLVLQMLLGEHIERSTFTQPATQAALAPYLAVATAVRTGSINEFRNTVQKVQKALHYDETYSLVNRLDAVVVRIGLRQLASAYSRVSTDDIAQKLGIASAVDAEFIIAKAIKDGIVSGHLQDGVLISKGSPNVYNSKIPLENFQKRIDFLMGIYEEAQKAMRYPPQSHRTDLESAEAKKIREEEEMIDFLGDFDDDDDMDDEFF